MTTSTLPALRTGKICYIELPATDIFRSADFYNRAFGWPIRQHDHGSLAFDDSVGQVSGTWVLGRKPATEPGLIVSIMVASATATVTAIIAAGSEIGQPVAANAPEKSAWFRDPRATSWAFTSNRAWLRPK